MRILFSCILFSLLSFKLWADDAYRYYINLTAVTNDKLQIELLPPSFNEDEVQFCFPAMVPGTYSVYDFGRFVSNFKALDKSGKEIPVQKADVNTFTIRNARSLSKITYEVEDTWDTAIKESVVFEPGGTNIEASTVFGINTHGFFGYFKNHLRKNYVLEFDKPEGFYPSTGLTDLKIATQKDIITAPDYYELVDSPILYCRPDTTTIEVANTQVLVSSYSPNKKISSAFIASTLKELLYAQKDYLGGELPVKKYAFLFNFVDKPTLSGASGALEHSYSSFYVLYEMPDTAALRQTLRDVCAHEFFHIVTPLNIHSKEIGDFDFNKPVMSKHLWLYEGMTEYAAHHAQARAGLIEIDKFFEVMIEKYQNSLEQFNDTMSFTYMSKNVLNPKIYPQYGNVYEKGALIGLCLDILMRHYSHGNYGTQNLMKDLALKYGKHQSFNDEDLFADIEKLTFPEIGTFLKRYVEGKEPLPLADVLKLIGINLEKERKEMRFTLGGMDVGYNDDTKRLVFLNVKKCDEFGKQFKFKEGDELFKLNNTVVDMEQVQNIFAGYYQNLKEGDEVWIEVYRPKRKGKYKLKKLNGFAKKVEVTQKNVISLIPGIDEQQKQTLKAWIGYQL